MYTLTVLEPRGVLKNPTRKGLFAPRLDTLNGKKIAILDHDSPLFFEIFEELLAAKYPTVEFVHYRSLGAPNSPDISAEIAANCDAWIDGVKACETGSKKDPGALLEKHGRPGVSIVSEAIIRAKQQLSDINGMPTVRNIYVSSVDYLSYKLDREKLQPLARAFLPQIVDALTQPLTEAEKNVSDLMPDYSPKAFTGEDYAEVFEKFQQYVTDEHLTDGLPVAPPTREAVDRMLAGTPLAPDTIIGYMYPKFGIATVEKIAISAVMAGALPEHLPVIIAIVETIASGDFNQYHIVNEILPITFLSGPIVEKLKLNCEVGTLAPGHRGNAAIGRALLMCMINIGWRDMTIYASPGGLGQPAAYANYFICENQKDSPWESYAESVGFKNGESVITVCEALGAYRGPSETLTNDTFEQRMEKMARMFASGGEVFGIFGMPRDARDMRHMISIHPTFVKQLADHGYTREGFIQWLYDISAKEVNGTKLEPFSAPENVAVMVSGSGAGGTIVFSTVCGSTANVEDVVTQRPFMHKIVREK
jgi:hypothetical protein